MDQDLAQHWVLKEGLKSDDLVEGVESGHHGLGHDCHGNFAAGSLADGDHQTVVDSAGIGSEVRSVQGRCFDDTVERHYAC